MATISALTTFNLVLNPKRFLFEDTTDWAGQGINTADVNGCFAVTSPSNILIYNNTDFSNSGCDIWIDNSLESQQLISLPVNSSGIVEPGNYIITYTTYDSNLEEYSIQEYTYNFTYETPELCITQTVDCVSPLFSAVDATDYVISGATLDLDRDFSLHFPVGSGADPLETSGATISTSSFYSGTQTSQLTSNLEYTFTSGYIVVDSITGVKEVLVDCDYFCSIWCCIASLKSRMQAELTTNYSQYLKTAQLFNTVMGLVEFMQVSITCGKSNVVDGCLDLIKTLTNCTDDCSCSGDEPTLIVGLGGSASITYVEGGGSPVIVTEVVVGNERTYTVSLSDAFINQVNGLLNTNIVGGDHFVITSNTVGSLKTFTLNTETTPIEYADLLLLYNNEELTPGFYEITDWQFTGEIPNASEVTTGPIEPLIVQAVSNIAFATDAYAKDFPQDIIKYEIIDTSTQGGLFGRITYRKDTEKNLEAYFDWRNAIFRRWETSVGSGIFTEFTDPGGGEAFVDRNAFVSTNSTFLSIGDCSGMHLPNIVFRDTCQNVRIESNCTDMNFGNSNTLIHIDEGCSNITLGNGANAIHFGHGVNGVLFGTNAANIYLEDYCSTITIGNSCSSLKINAGSDITFGNSCLRNTIGYACNTLSFGNSCSYITIGSNNTNFIIGASNTNFEIGNNNDGFVTGTSCSAMNVGSNTTSNTFGNGANNITIGDSCASLQFGLAASSLRISDSCSSWIVEDDCSLIVAESGVNNIVMADTCTNMVFKQSCGGLTFTAGANKNYFEAGTSGIDFTGATHVYLAYDCTIFTNANGDQRLSYFDAADALTVDLPTN